MRFSDFGWSDGSRDLVVRALCDFVGERDGAETVAGRLYELLAEDVSRSSYPMSSELYIEEGRITLLQSDFKEYYHDGSEQARRDLVLERLSEEDYRLLEEFAVTDGSGYMPAGAIWYEAMGERFFVEKGVSSGRYSVVARDFLSIGPVRLTAENYI